MPFSGFALAWPAQYTKYTTNIQERKTKKRKETTRKNKGKPIENTPKRS